MTVTTVRLGRTYGLPNYESVRVDLEARLEEGEDIEMALDQLAQAARLYKASRFDKKERDPLGLREFLEVTVSHKTEGGSELLTEPPRSPPQK